MPKRNILIEYQKLLGLVPDGIIGRKTLAAIQDDLKMPTLEATAHMLGQSRLESAGFTAIRENMNYSAQALANTWARFSITGKRGGKPNTAAIKLAHKPIEIANTVYANRNGNGGYNTGDGWLYRGGLAIQTTGRKNWENFFLFVGMSIFTNPDILVSLPEFPKLYFQGGAFFFSSNDLNRYCTGSSDMECTVIGKGVNLGNVHSTITPLDNDIRIQYTQQIYTQAGLA